MPPNRIRTITAPKNGAPPQFSLVTADLSIRNLQRCIDRHRLHHAAKQNAALRFSACITKAPKTGNKRGNIPRTSHAFDLKGEGGSSASPSPAFDSSTIRHTGWRGILLRPRCAIDWLEHMHARFPACPHGFSGFFPGSPKTGKQSRQQCEGDNHGRSTYTGSGQSRSRYQPAPDHQRDDDDER